MSLIEIETMIVAPIERVFDLSRSVEVHQASTSHTSERAVAGVTSGLLGMGDQVTWQATHFGVRQRLSTRVVELRRPHHFRDSMVSGAFRSFNHDHHFFALDSGVLVRDRFDFESPWGPLGKLANALFLTRYMHAFLRARAAVIKDVAESEAWRKYLRDGR